MSIIDRKATDAAAAAVAAAKKGAGIFAPVKIALNGAYASTGFYVDSDSTLTDSYPILRPFAQWLATEYPTHSVSYVQSNNLSGNTILTDAEFLSYGAAGERYVSGNENIYGVYPHSIFNDPIGIGFDLQVKFNVWDNTYAQKRILVSKSGADGNCGFFFYVLDGKIGILYSSSGTSADLVNVAQSTVAIRNADASHQSNGGGNLPLWGRITYNSSAQAFDFYDSVDDGATWQAVGSYVIKAGKPIYESTADWTVHGAPSIPSGYLANISGRIWRVRCGRPGGVRMMDDMIDQWSPAGSDMSQQWFFGSPELRVVNGSVGGTGVAWIHSDATRLKQFACWPRCPLVIVGKSFNHTEQAEAFVPLLATWKTQIAARFPAATIGVVLQGPRDPARNLKWTCLAHIERVFATLGWCQQNGGGGYIDTYSDYINTPNWPDLLNPADGVHPSTAGAQALVLQCFKDAWNAS